MKPLSKNRITSSMGHQWTYDYLRSDELKKWLNDRGCSVVQDFGISSFGIIQNIHYAHNIWQTWHLIDSGSMGIPNYFAYNNNFHVVRAEYRDGKTNKLHREKGPACIKYNNEGKIIELQFYKNGLIHRLSGPACIIFSGKPFYGQSLNARYHKVINPVKSIGYFYNGHNINSLIYELFGILPRSLSKSDQTLLKLSMPLEWLHPF